MYLVVVHAKASVQVRAAKQLLTGITEHCTTSVLLGSKYLRIAAHDSYTLLSEYNGFAYHSDRSVGDGQCDQRL